MDTSGRIRQHQRVVQVVAGALMAGVVILGGIAYFLVRSGAWQPMDQAVGQVVLYAGTVVMAVGLLTAPVLGVRLRDSLVQLPPDEVVRRYAAMVIGPQAVREGVGLMSVMTGLLAGSPTWILIFAAASVATQAMAFPRSGDLEALLRRRPDSP